MSRLQELQEVRRLAQECQVLRDELCRCSMIYQFEEKVSAARNNRVPLNTYFEWEYGRWAVVRKAHHCFLKEVFAICRPYMPGVMAYNEFEPFRVLTGANVRKRLGIRRVRALPWPTVLLNPQECGLCHIAEPEPGKKSLHGWLVRNFKPLETVYGLDLYIQFMYIFSDVMESNLAKRDRGVTGPLDISSPLAMPTITRRQYSSADVANWWLETSRQIGY